MLRRIYHGSSQIVREPHFGAGRAYNDFGLGFYCTDSAELAREWAVGRNSNGFANRYTLNDTGLRIIDLGSPQYCVLHWLSVISNYREFDAPSSAAYQAKEYIRTVFSVDSQNCDCMIGYRADNCNFTFAQDFLNGHISYGQLRDCVKSGKTGRQFVLKSNRAFDRVVFDGYRPAWSIESFPHKVSRDREAMIFARNTDPSDELYISQILDEEVKPYDPRLR